MSAKVSRGAPPKGAVRNSQRSKMVLGVDLNSPPCETRNDVGTSSRGPAQSGQQPPPQPVTIDVDSLDDDVILTSPRAFAEAKNNSRRTRSRPNVVDVDLEFAGRHAVNNCNKRQRVPPNQPIINCDLYVNLERNRHAMDGAGMIQLPRRMVQPPPPPPPKEPTFSCPVCMGPLVEETSTKCGHIFCKACIKQAIAARNKCPTCRRRVTVKDTFRIYLPATS